MSLSAYGQEMLALAQANPIIQPFLAFVKANAALAPAVTLRLGVSGTGGGFEKFCRGQTDLSNASRPIQEDEAALCEDNGVEFTEVRIAWDGLSVVANPANDFAQCLTTDELRRIWEPGSTVDNWSQVRDGFPDQRMVLYGPGTDSGTFDYFTEEIGGETGASRPDYTASEDDNVLVQGVTGDEHSMGYFGYAYYIENQGSVCDSQGCQVYGCGAEPSAMAIQAGSNPRVIEQKLAAAGLQNTSRCSWLTTMRPSVMLSWIASIVSLCSSATRFACWSWYTNSATSTATSTMKPNLSGSCSAGYVPGASYRNSSHPIAPTSNNAYASP